MESATTRFFTIPELLAMLIPHLNHNEISKLMRTSRLMHQLCTPAHYHSVDSNFRPGHKTLLSSKQCIRALYKNVNFVRQLVLGLEDLIYYFNCVVDYQDRLSRETGQPLLEQPRWLYPRDPHICPVLPIPPMTLLTRLEINIHYPSKTGEQSVCPYSLPTYRDPRATTTRICWLLQLNPHLTRVTIAGLVFKDNRDTLLLTTSIFGLDRLQDLYISATYWEPTKLNLIPNIFFSCPPSLRVLSIDLFEEDRQDYDGVLTVEYQRLWPGRLHSWEVEVKECGLTAVPQRQEPLVRLTTLMLMDTDEFVDQTAMGSILAHCPNLRNLKMPCTEKTEDNDDNKALATAVARSCPKLRDLTYQDYIDDGANGALLLRIMDTLPPQQVEQLTCKRRPFDIRGLDVTALFKRHSNTLRTLCLVGCRNVRSKAIKILLNDCRCIERLEVSWGGNRHELCIDLEDTVEFPWACIRVESLALTIAVPDEPLHLHTGTEPYYNRPPPTILSETEKKQFEQLEVLYRQIGTLTELTCLKLEVFYYDPQGVRPLSNFTKSNTFPGMLSLGDCRYGRPGFLHHLAGLTNLRVLAGSISATTEETSMTMGWAEAEWIYSNWPALEKVNFFPRNCHIRAPYKWLLEQRDNLKVSRF
ncbi:hypothetical protein EC957_007540 [Mortierella hygrophila]|uniref:Uncharacterized protein n=1 Tax=Mortierella hygrophila TaxID=979708 RepID=A0A9P6EXW6_9FUNG|nr:hypothetical protein EC957_007540 [Mortierella hygrophila]